MIQKIDRRLLSHWGRMALASVAAAVLLSGCGGGGGGGGGGGITSPQAQTTTITGQLQDKSTSNVLPGRTVTVQNTSLSAISDPQGNFTINSVPVTSITLSVVDSNGTSDGVTGPIDLSKVGGNPKNIGVVVLDIYGNGPPAPPGG